jgi:hypothetical protein
MHFLHAVAFVEFRKPQRRVFEEYGESGRWLRDEWYGDGGPRGFFIAVENARLRSQPRARTGYAKLPMGDVAWRSRLGLDYFVADGVANQFGHGVTIQSAHDIGAVRFSGFHAQAQRDRDFLAALAFG